MKLEQIFFVKEAVSFILRKQDILVKEVLSFIMKKQDNFLKEVVSFMKTVIRPINDPGMYISNVFLIWKDRELSFAGKLFLEEIGVLK